MGDWSLTATVFFGVLSVVLSLALYFRTRRYKRLTLTYHRTELQTKRHPEIIITFNGRQIENLSRLRGVCWNSGTDEIRWEDIPAGPPPMVVFTNARVLSVVGVGATVRTAFGVGQPDDHSASAHFGFLNPGDYGLFEVLFEALPAGWPESEFDARVIGGDTDTQLFYPQPKSVKRQLLFSLPLVLATTAMFLVRGRGPIPEVVSTIAVLAAAILVFWGTSADTRVLHRARLPAAAKRFLAGRETETPKPGAQTL